MLNPPLLSVGSVPLTLTRRTLPTYVNGRLVPGTSTEVIITANVQPVLKSSDTMLIPEADRSKACLKVYSKGEPIQQLKEGVNGWDADLFTWQGDVYEVMKVINYEMGILNHYKAICMRKEQT